MINLRSLTLFELVLLCGNIHDDTPLFIYTSMANLESDNALVRDKWEDVPKEHMTREVRFFRYSPDTESMTIVIN